MNKRIAIAVSALLTLLPAATALLVLRSPAALRWVVAQTEKRFPGQLKIGGIDGTLMGPVRFTDVRIDEPAFSATIGTLSIDWRPLALLSHSLYISRLRALDVDARIKAQPQSTAFRLLRPRPPHLPVALIIHDLQVNHLRVSVPQLQQPVSVDHAELTARLDNKAWTVHALHIEGQSVRVAGDAAWEFRHDEQVQARLQWQLTLPQQPTLIGEVHLVGNEQTMHLRASLNAPFRLLLTGELHHMFTAPAWHGSLEFSELDPRRLHPGWPELTVDGKLDLRGDPDATVLLGGINAHQEKFGAWRSHVDLRWADKILAIRKLDLERTQSDTRFNLSGKLSYTDGKLVPEIRGEWHALNLPLTGKPWFRSPRGRLEIHMQDHQALLAVAGTLSNGGNFDAHAEASVTPRHNWRLNAGAQKFRLALRSLNKNTPLPVMNWRLQAHGDDTQIQVDSFASAWLSGHVLADGKISLVDGQRWQFNIQAQGIDPAVLYPELPGALAFSARVSGRFSEPSAWKLKLTTLDGELRKQPVQVSGSLECAAGSWRFQNVIAHIGANSLRLDGRYGQQTQVTWKLDAPDLSGLWPGIAGRLSTEGNLALTRTAPGLSLKLSGEALRYHDYAVGKITARISTQAGSASLDATGVQINDLKIDTLNTHAIGSAGAQELSGKFTSPYGSAIFEGSGTINNGVWRTDFREVTLKLGDGGEWQNQTPWHMQIDAQGFNLPQACVNQGTAQGCLQVDWQPSQWQVDAMLADVPLHDLQALLPEGLEYQGSFGGTLHMQGLHGRHVLDVNASLSPGAIHNVINGQRVTLLAYTNGSLKLHSDTKLTSAQLNWRLTDGGYMDIDSQISHGNQPMISGSIQGEMHQFDLIPALIPEVGGLDGNLRVDFKLAGTPTDPRFMGTASFVDGEALIPRFGLHVTDVSLNLNGDGEHLELDGKAHSGKGSLDWQSSATWTERVWHAQGKVHGEDFRVAEIPEAQVDVSPDIDFKLDNRDLYLNGTVAVPYAKLRPRDLTHTAQVSPDQVIVGANGGPAAAKWRVHSQVRVNMGKDVDLAGFGVSGRITGGVLAVDEPGHSTTGTGELQIVDGQYTAYGQKLKIDRGRLMFNGGPISNPALDVRAIRPPAHPETLLPGTNEQTVGVLVRGSLRNPIVTLFSNPPLTQAQMLTYLLTGQAPVNPNLSPQGAPPTTASYALAQNGGQFLAQEVGQEVGQHVGIEDVNVQNVSTGLGTSTAALFFGKYLSPRLYVSYGVGLLQPLNTVRIRYTLSTRWMLEAESGSFANSADLIYSIEH